MAIITDIPKTSWGEVPDALMREINTGFAREKAYAKKRDERAAKEAQLHKGKHSNVEALGRCVATIHPKDYFRLIRKYGHEEVGSDEFIRYFQKKHPQLAPNKI